MNDPSVITRTVEKTNVWLDEIATEMEGDRREAYRLLRAYLHALRDRLSVDEVAQLAAQLPELIRGIYYENWNPGRIPAHHRDLDHFLDQVATEAGLSGETSASFAVAAVADVIARHVSAGELADIRGQLPKDLRPVVKSSG